MENKININDLMIGNLVNYEQTTHIITEITDRVISSRWYKQPIDEPDYECSIDEIKSIPLNKEILLKCGFKFNKCGISGADMWQGLDIWSKDGITLRGDVDCKFGLKLAGFINTEYRYIHELQNLFYIVTKQHLQINL